MSSSPNVAKDTVVTVKYKVSEAHGRLIEDAQHPLVYLHGGYENTLPKIEEALDGQAKGYKISLNLSVADAFGERDESLCRVIPRSEFPPGVKIGGQLQGQNDAGQPQIYTVMKIKGPEVHLDGNHPLAGRALKFDLQILDVRPASAEEIAHGHVHGEHGHQH